MIDHALTIADVAGAAPRIANLHYLGEQLASHLAGRDVGLSWECEVILETGGGLRAALPLLGPGPVMTLNTDAVWTGPNPLIQLANAWNDTTMDALLLLLPGGQARGHTGAGDFLLDQTGRLIRANGSAGAVYLGAQILQTDMLPAIPDSVFSLNRVWDQMIGKGRAYGLFHQGGWCDVGRPEGLAEAEALLADV